ncbi:hypothetical protein [Thermodesulfomicrobium sp. WS]|uniref:hypothetical protein n=1 Tax=Thermodesulfomicrobium sp. WS TaxID=3004129 RepID=UPI00248FD3E3|nr:hypothetical protein [Thermodesulfomicrobium sp. WS]
MTSRLAWKRNVLPPLGRLGISPVNPPIALGCVLSSPASALLRRGVPGLRRVSDRHGNGCPPLLALAAAALWEKRLEHTGRR